jgi:hypothetical protein
MQFVIKKLHSPFQHGVIQKTNISNPLRNKQTSLRSFTAKVAIHNFMQQRLDLWESEKSRQLKEAQVKGYVIENPMKLKKSNISQTNQMITSSMNAYYCIKNIFSF